MDRLAALHLLEEAAQQCRYGKPERTDELKQALRTLLTPATKPHTIDFWNVLASGDAHRFQSADQALGWIYTSLGIPRDPAVAQTIWERLYEAQLTPEFREERAGWMQAVKTATHRARSSR
jgi:hypothetical protein